MVIDQEQRKIASLIISIIILIIVIVLIVIVCCNWNTNTQQPIMQNINKPLAAAAIYKPLGAYAYKQIQKNNFETCGLGKFGSVQCCGKPNGTNCTHNQKLGQCFGGDCDTTCGGGDPQCQCAHDGVDCTLNRVSGNCYGGYCKIAVKCTQPTTSWFGICQTMTCMRAGVTGDICARSVKYGAVDGYCSRGDCVLIYDAGFEDLSEAADDDNDDDN
jgi:hypothetical protein